MANGTGGKQSWPRLQTETAEMRYRTDLLEQPDTLLLSFGSFRRIDAVLEPSTVYVVPQKIDHWPLRFGLPTIACESAADASLFRMIILVVLRLLDLRIDFVQQCRAVLVTGG